MENGDLAVSHASRRVRWRAILETITTLAMLAASLTIVAARFRKDPPVRTATESTLPATPISLDGASIKGSRSAPIALLMFSDFQCPFCARFAKEGLPGIEPHIKAGRAMLAFRHLPLANHPLAQKAAEAALCAGRQGKFWEAHDHLFGDVERLRPPGLLSIKDTLALDGTDFGKCLAGETAAEVRRDVEEATTLGITGTPVFLIGDIERDGRLRVQRMLMGARGVKEALDGVVDGLKRKR